jgi:glycosyltransferase involved in cell wall biosynthesis
MLLSIIIPAHRAGNKLNECLNSIKNQTQRDLWDYEVIIVSDHDTDRNVAKYQNFVDEMDFPAKVLINEYNQGPGPARQYGVDHSDGEYVIFIDADDFLFENAFQIINDNITENKDSKVFLGPIIISFEGDGNQMQLDAIRSFCYVLGDVFHRDVFQQVHFHETLFSHEDIYFKQSLDGCIDFPPCITDSVFYCKNNSSNGITGEVRQGLVYPEIYIDDYVFAYLEPLSKNYKTYLRHLNENTGKPQYKTIKDDFQIIYNNLFSVLNALYHFYESFYFKNTYLNKGIIPREKFLSIKKGYDKIKETLEMDAEEIKEAFLNLCTKEHLNIIQNGEEVLTCFNYEMIPMHSLFEFIDMMDKGEF